MARAESAYSRRVGLPIRSATLRGGLRSDATVSVCGSKYPLPILWSWPDDALRDAAKVYEDPLVARFSGTFGSWSFWLRRKWDACYEPEARAPSASLRVKVSMRSLIAAVPKPMARFGARLSPARIASGTCRVVDVDPHARGRPFSGGRAADREDLSSFVRSHRPPAVGKPGSRRSQYFSAVPLSLLHAVASCTGNLKAIHRVSSSLSRATRQVHIISCSISASPESADARDLHANRAVE